MPDFAPAYLSLGVAHENTSNFEQAVDGFRKFLAFGRKNDLPELEQQAQIRQRLLVCERRHEVDVQLAKNIPGVWVASNTLGEEPKMTTTATSEKSSETTTRPNFQAATGFQLMQNGDVMQKTGSEWTKVENGSWKVVGRRLLVAGLVGKSGEWYNAGPLTPAGDRFDGVNMQLHRIRHVRQRQFPNAENLIGKWVVADELAGGRVAYTIEFRDKGKITASIRVDSETHTVEGNYKLDGDKLETVASFNGKEFKDTLTIVNLTDEEIGTKGSGGEEGRFKKVKPPK